MSAIMKSISPKECERIANGEQTVLVSKTRPKIETPFKCYIYATKPKKWFRFSNYGYASDECLWLTNGKVKMCDGFEFWADGTEYEPLCCKVIGEFVCDRITDISVPVKNCNEDYNHVYHNDECKGSCLTWKELQEYGNGKPLYAWHISDIKIYDKPKELEEFYTIDESGSDCCCGCVYHETPLAEMPCKACTADRRYLYRPPQSWCYVEEL